MRRVRRKVKNGDVHTPRYNSLGSELNFTASSCKFVRVGEHPGIGGIKEMTNIIVGFDISIEDIAQCVVEGK